MQRNFETLFLSALQNKTRSALWGGHPSNSFLEFSLNSYILSLIFLRKITPRNTSNIHNNEIHLFSFNRCFYTQ